MESAPASTIYALASAPGRAGVAVFRISGPAALEGMRFLGIEQTLEPRKAALVQLTHQGAALDQSLALYFPAPHSFTGEDVVELHTHGSRAVTKLLLEALESIPGLRMAEAGEFARRAFMNGKLDLAQAEGLADLIDAETTSQHAQAMRQLGGVTTQRVEVLRMQVLEPLALMEAYIDFPDEEIPEAVIAEATERVATLKQAVAMLLADGGIGEKIREGLDIVITGPPNAGKSTLLNWLAKRDAAIVSPEAGTTRDLIEIPMEIAGYAVTLVDTAGIRDHAAMVEAEGIRRALHRAEHADIILALSDSVSIPESFDEFNGDGAKNILRIATKSDLVAPARLPAGMLPISVATGAGLDAFLAALTALVAQRMDSVASPLITRARHRAALKEALACLERFNIQDPLELVCEELRLAAQAIGKITGKIWVDDVLDLVFSRFCIGK